MKRSRIRDDREKLAGFEKYSGTKDDLGFSGEVVDQAKDRLIRWLSQRL